MMPWHLPIAIPQGADMLTNFTTTYMRRLFQRVRLFSADFLQLVLITIFAGWAIHRFRRG